MKRRPHPDSVCARELLRQHLEAKRSGDLEYAQTLACKYRKVLRRTGALGAPV